MGEADEAHDVSVVEPHPVTPLRSRSLSVVIPIYNEEEILAQTVDNVLAGVKPLNLTFFELLLCENGSTDATLSIAHEIARRHDAVDLVVLSEADYGAAMREGFRAAKGEVIVNFDADYYDFDFLDAAMRTDGDIVVAAKGVLGSDDTRILVRRVVSKSFGWLVRTILGVKVAETHGMKLFHRDAIVDLLPEVRSTKDLFDTELLARSEWMGHSIRALPIRTEELRHSRSGIVRRIPRTLWGLVRMRLRLRRVHAARVRNASNSNEGRIAV
jgi:glycosyltransferase involved in cell wall biosynthesis